MSGSGEFKPVTWQGGETTDLALLPKRFDRFAAEMRTALELLGLQILPIVKRLDHTTSDLAIRMTSMNRDLTQLSQRVTALEKRVAKKQSRSPTKRPPPAKARTRKAKK